MPDNLSGAPLGANAGLFDPLAVDHRDSKQKPRSGPRHHRGQPSTGTQGGVPADAGSATASGQRAMVTFHGRAWSGYPQDRTILMGDKGPVITDGYAKWQTIDRPLTRGLTVFQGYNPTTMTLDLRFGWFATDGVGGPRWDDSDEAGRGVEQDIHWISWMAGELFGFGPSPVVYLHVYDADATPLIPLRFQGDKFPWILTGITWNQAWRNAQGNRIYQEADLTLMEYVSAPGQKAPPSDTARGRGHWFTVPGTPPLQKGVHANPHPGATFPFPLPSGPKWTPLRIANHESPHKSKHYVARLAQLIVDAPQNHKLRLKRRGIQTPIAPGTRVWVPPMQ